MEAITIIADDGYRLAAHRFTAEGGARGVVLLPAAMGVRQDFYFPFAAFLAERGFCALTFDYRGMGASRPSGASLRGFVADLGDWAGDYGAVLRYARNWQPALPVLVVGHSLGGQLPGLVRDNTLIDAIVTVAAGNGYWRINSSPLRHYVWLIWYLVAPLATALFGYFPGRRLKIVGDLPKGVMRQWSRWCRSPHNAVDDLGRPMHAGFGRLRVPLLALSFTDDEMMSRRSIDSLHDFYRNTEQERRYIAPQDVGARRIGHFGFFRGEFRTSLWTQVLEWLERNALAPPTAARDARLMHTMPA
jgi:predicted alpha/beta hydrolase